MAEIYYESDTDLKLLDGKVIGIIGYGSQGHAQAQNLRDSGCQVIVAEVEGSEGWKNATEAGFEVLAAEEVAGRADIIMMLAPDTLQRSIYYGSVEKGLRAGKMLMFAHGFNIHYGQITPPADVDVTMIAPKCPGHMLRELYTQGVGPPALVAIEQDASGKAGDGPCLCQGHRLRAGRRAGNYLCRGNRDRPLWRTGGAVRGGLHTGKSWF